MNSNALKPVLEHRQRIDRAISLFSARHMSNAKWRKLFGTLANFTIHQLVWRFVDSADPLTTHFAPLQSELLENGIRDGRFCPFEFREIESIEIPAAVMIKDRYGSLTRTHDLDGIEAAIDRLGRFCLTRDEKSIVVHGYT